MSKVRQKPPIAWFGGKTMIVKHILDIIDNIEHNVYVVVFGGSGATLFAKAPENVEIYNDLDDGLITLYRVIRDPVMFERFRLKAELTLISRSEYEASKLWYQHDDPVDRAHGFFVLARQSYGAKPGSGWMVNKTSHRRSRLSKACQAWMSTVNRLPQIHERLRTVQIEQRDFREIFPLYDSDNTLFYVDPPYVPETRRSGKYQHELSLQDHVELIDILLNIRGKAIVSGYENSLYDKLDRHGWERKEHKTVSHTSKVKDKRTEVMWYNDTGKQLKLF